MLLVQQSTDTVHVLASLYRGRQF
uniref:Uncharacterized protein n=1 Tax=Arundo donax TaxID=35708 RepID=A0A0A9B0M0_ARUDO